MNFRLEIPLPSWYGRSMGKYPQNNQEYLSRCPALDGVDEYGLQERRQLTPEEHQRIIAQMKKVRELLGLDEPSQTDF